MTALKALDSAIERIAEDAGATYISLLPTLCEGKKCKATLDGAVLYFDDNHLTVAGETLIATKLLAPVLWPGKTAADAVEESKPTALP
jgi:hypothetical protein